MYTFKADRFGGVDISDAQSGEARHLYGQEAEDFLDTVNAARNEMEYQQVMASYFHPKKPYSVLLLVLNGTPIPDNYYTFVGAENAERAVEIAEAECVWAWGAGDLKLYPLLVIEGTHEAALQLPSDME